VLHAFDAHFYLNIIHKKKCCS